VSEATAVSGGLSRTHTGPDNQGGPHVSCTLLPNLVVRAVLVQGSDLNEASVAQLREQLGALAGTRKVAVVLELTGIASISRTALASFASIATVSCWAIVGSTPVDRLVAHILLSTEPGSAPAGYFTTEREALDWLTSLDGT
jgi:threonine dehydrogenase-like Zn-dependent dehydrogenase